jgi:hypothetical protein
MAVTESTFGMQHPTVVPTNFEPTDEESVDEEMAGNEPSGTDSE